MKSAAAETTVGGGRADQEDVPMDDASEEEAQKVAR